MNRSITIVLFVLLAGFFVAPGLSAQPRVAGSSEANGAQSVGSQVDEEFDLDIRDKRIDTGRLEAATDVHVGNDSVLSLSIGVAIAADNVHIHLREVVGHVRFRGSLDRVLEVIESRRRVR